MNNLRSFYFGSRLASQPLMLRRAVLLMMMATACSRGPQKNAPASNPATVITPALQTLISDEHLTALTVTRGRSAPVRQMGVVFRHALPPMVSDLAAIARRRSLAAAPALLEKQVALEENLQMVAGELFDQGYSLAMIDDMTVLSHLFDAMDASNDEELKQFAARYRPVVARQLAQSDGVLKELGGSPFGFTP